MLVYYDLLLRRIIIGPEGSVRVALYLLQFAGEQGWHGSELEIAIIEFGVESDLRFSNGLMRNVYVTQWSRLRNEQVLDELFFFSAFIVTMTSMTRQ